MKEKLSVTHTEISNQNSKYSLKEQDKDNPIKKNPENLDRKIQKKGKKKKKKKKEKVFLTEILIAKHTIMAYCRYC